MPLAAATTILTALFASEDFVGNWNFNYSDHATRLRSDLLYRNGYDKAVPPRSVRLVNYSDAGTDVQLQIRFFKAIEVVTSQGRMTVKAWFRQSWTDLRLSWDPAEYGGVESVKFFAHTFGNPEVSEIWLPDVTVYNAVAGLMHAFDPAMAVVNHRGEVYWTRPGNLEVLCRFSGIVMFPFDQMSCPIDVGGWIAGGGTQGLSSASSGCASMDGSEEVSRTSYSDVELDEVECSEHTYHYPCCPNDPYPIIKYRLKVRREPGYYLRWTLIPSVIVAWLSFSVFFMSFEVGERLGVGVTLVLTNEISRSSLQSHIPICGEMVWLDMLILLNMTFSMLSLVESCIVLGLSLCTSEDLMPRGIRDILTAMGRASPRISDAYGSVFDTRDSIAGQLWRSGRCGVEQLGAGVSVATQGVASGVSAAAGAGNTAVANTTGAATASASDKAVSLPGGAPSSRSPRSPGRLTPTMVSGGRMPSMPVPPSPPPSPASRPASAADRTPSTHEPNSAVAPSMDQTPLGQRNSLPNIRWGPPRREDVSHADLSSKLIFFENLFFNLDVDGGGTITFDEMRRMLAFMALELSTEERENALRHADSSGEADGKLTRYEYMDLCVQILWNQPLDQMKEAAHSYADYRSALKRRANMKWRTTADRVDRAARFWFPTLYIAMFSTFYSLELTDMYTGAADLYSADGTEVLAPWNSTGQNAQVVRLHEGSIDSEKWVPMQPWFRAIIFKERFGGRPLLVGVFVALFFLILFWAFVQYRNWRSEKLALQRGRNFASSTSGFSGKNLTRYGMKEGRPTIAERARSMKMRKPAGKKTVELGGAYKETANDNEESGEQLTDLPA